MAQAQIDRQKSTHDPAADPSDVEPVPQPHAKEVSDETADLLDDIDELLNELPEDLAVNFLQVGGE
jgi:DNA-directed RNA polymerase specialized sigma24 family protein